MKYPETGLCSWKCVLLNVSKLKTKNVHGSIVIYAGWLIVHTRFLFLRGKGFKGFDFLLWIGSSPYYLYWAYSIRAAASGGLWSQEPNKPSGEREREAERTIWRWRASITISGVANGASYIQTSGPVLSRHRGISLPHQCCQPRNGKIPDTRNHRFPTYLVKLPLLSSPI